MGGRQVRKNQTYLQFAPQINNVDIKKKAKKQKIPYLTLEGINEN